MQQCSNPTVITHYLFCFFITRGMLFASYPPWGDTQTETLLIPYALRSKRRNIDPTKTIGDLVTFSAFSSTPPSSVDPFPITLCGLLLITPLQKETAASRPSSLAKIAAINAGGERYCPFCPTRIRRSDSYAGQYSSVCCVEYCSDPQ